MSDIQTPTPGDGSEVPIEPGVVGTTVVADAVAPAPAELPPGLDEGISGLIKKNLFKDAKNSVLTIIFAIILAYIAYRAVGFVFFNEKVTPDGDTRSAWDVIRLRLEIYMVGTSFAGTGIGFARLWASIYVIAFAMGFASGKVPGDDTPPITMRARLGILAPPILMAIVLLIFTETITPTLLTLAIAIPFLVGQQVPRFLPERVLMRRGWILFGLAVIAFGLETSFSFANINDFGGLLLTINVAFISIVACFPIGVILALTRRSSFPLLRPLAVIYIELIRGVPLITLLFMGQFALRFFFPPNFDPPGEVIRAIIMFTLFSAAYVAEIVRGGLQSVPAGQTEAGQAVGLSPVKITRRIVLPQALRNSIPALVGQFIALLKDTTLLIVIGLFDLLGVSDPILANPEFQNQGYAPEVYAFVAFIFWVMCFAMSRASQRLETKLGVGTR